jgi:hypothetical protein
VHTQQGGPLDGKRILALLTGPDNERDYTAFAFVNDNGIVVWKKKRSKDLGKLSVFEHYAEMLWYMAVGHGDLMDNYELITEGVCLVCNRALTTPDSCRRGVGPVCAGKM